MKTLGNIETNLRSLQRVLPKVHLTMFVEDEKREDEKTALHASEIYDFINC